MTIYKPASISQTLNATEPSGAGGETAPAQLPTGAVDRRR
jgi:hypothetical protein